MGPFVVLASLRPREELENLIAGWRRAGARTWSVGNLVVEGPAQIRGAHLRELLAAAGSPNAPDLRAWTYSFEHAH